MGVTEPAEPVPGRATDSIELQSDGFFPFERSIKPG